MTQVGRTPRAWLQCWGLRDKGCANVLFTAFSLFQPSRLRIVNNTLPKISLRSLPGFGHQVDFNTQLLVESRYGVSIRGMAWRGGVTISLEGRWSANVLSCLLCFPLDSVPGQPLCEQVEVDVTMLVQDTWTAHQNALNCKTVDINTYVRYESGVR